MFKQRMLTSWLLFLMFIVILLLSHLVSLDMCSTWLYRFLTIAVFLILIYLTDRKDLNKLIGNMIKDRKSSTAEISEETLLDYILTYTDDEEIQLADALEFATAGQYVLEYCKLYL